MSHSHFDSAFDELIGLEGGYVNNSADPGGETKYGISKRSYPDVDIKNLTLEDAKQIYWRDFWNPLLLQQVNDSDIATEIFEQAVNMGRFRAVRHAQQALSMVGSPVAIDGLMGPQTLGALNTIGDRKPALCKTMNGFQFMFYLNLAENRAGQDRFFVGWLRRISYGGHNA